ncbi:MAG: protein tyrosine phosphatase [Balneola sp.]|nr:protein tyrosine phosphatase [Balneola sp.]|tara:strand:+ start:10648 stop:11163 length:516 start_codon:yes stop_codon:yes gene_type:complete
MEFHPNRNITKKKPYRICFVCLGNICRSPTAEGIFQQKVTECDLNTFFYIDSAGTSAYHVGEKANAISRRIAESHGVSLLSRARQFNSKDFYKFDLILAMDSSNYTNIMKLKSGITNSQVELMRSFDPIGSNEDVPDPYYGGINGFENVFTILMRSSEELLKQLSPYLVNE